MRDPKTVIDNSYLNKKTARIRWRKTLEFLPEKLRDIEVLDMGDRTPITEALEKKWDCRISNTEGDLDFLELSGQYNVVISFEVLEHLLNPLYNLSQINKVLKKDGRLFLSTPCGKPYFLWAEGHFHELRWERLDFLISKAGFKVERKIIFKVHPWYFFFKGVRPLIRLLYHRHWFLELSLNRDIK